MRDNRNPNNVSSESIVLGGMSSGVPCTEIHLYVIYNVSITTDYCPIDGVWDQTAAAADRSLNIE